MHRRRAVLYDSVMSQARGLPLLAGAAVLAASVLAATAAGSERRPVQRRPELDRRFADAGVDGVFVLYDPARRRLGTNHLERADRGFLPASTFKVLNSLIALETKVIAGADEVLPWDGVERGWEQWDRDHSLRSAIKVSAVWFYQELARRIGQARMQRWVDAAGYGNRDISGGIDTFWLEGGLRISARQQAEFLARLQRGDLPFSPAVMATVRDVLEVERGDGWVLRAKTGWAAGAKPQVGWWVGWVERSDGVQVFALNLDIVERKDAKAREAVGRAVLVDLGVLPE